MFLFRLLQKKNMLTTKQQHQYWIHKIIKNQLSEGMYHNSVNFDDINCDKML